MSQSIQELAERFLQLSSAITAGDELVKGTRAKSREALNAELAPYLAQLEGWKEEKRAAAEVLLPEFIRMYEARRVKSFAGIQLRRGKTWRAVLPDEESPEYRALALLLLPLVDTGGEPLVELKIKSNRLNDWIKANGMSAATALGIEIAATDTLAPAPKGVQ